MVIDNQELINQVLLRFDKLTNVLSNPYIAAATISTAVIAIVGFIWNAYQLGQQRKVGLSIEIVDDIGNGIIRNNSQSDYIVELNKYVLDDGLPSAPSQANPQTINNLKSLNESALIKKTIEGLVKTNKKDILVLSQSLAPNESLKFHIHELIAENTTVAFIVLEFIRNKKKSYQLYRFAGRLKAGLIPHELQSLCQPYNQWVRVFGFTV